MAPKTIESHQGLKISDVVDVWDNELDDTRRAKVLEVGHSFPAVVVELEQTQWEPAQRVAMQQGPYTDSGRYRIVAVAEKAKRRFVIAATVKTDDDPDFPADVALFEADSRVEALRQADKEWPAVLKTGRFAGYRRALRVVDEDPDPVDSNGIGVTRGGLAFKVKPADTPTSHLRNALQVSTLLAAELPKMIGNPGYQDEAAQSLAAIDARIRAALKQLEGKSR